MKTPPLYEPVATFHGYDGETTKPVFTLIGTLNAGDKLCVCAPAQAAAPSENVRSALQFIHDTFKSDLDAGYKTRDKEFAVEIAAEALAGQPARQQAAPAAIPEGWRDTLNEVADVLVEHNWRGDLTEALRSLAAAPAMPALLDHAHAEPKGTAPDTALAFQSMRIPERFDASCSRCGRLPSDQEHCDWSECPAGNRAGEVSQGAAPPAIQQGE